MDDIDEPQYLSWQEAMDRKTCSQKLQQDLYSLGPDEVQVSPPETLRIAYFIDKTLEDLIYPEENQMFLYQNGLPFLEVVDKLTHKCIRFININTIAEMEVWFFRLPTKPLPEKSAVAMFKSYFYISKKGLNYSVKGSLSIHTYTPKETNPFA